MNQICSRALRVFCFVTLLVSFSALRVAGAQPTQPEITIRGNSLEIVNGDTTPSTDDFTQFGDALVGTPIRRTFTIVNDGDANLTLGDFTVPQGFSVTDSFSSPVAPQANTTFEITCNATSAGVYQGTLSLLNNDADEDPYSFALACTVTEPPAGVMSVSPDTQTANVGEVFFVNIIVNPDGEAINSAEVHLDFDPMVMEVQDVVGDGSPLSQIVAPTIDNDLGQISYYAGTLSSVSTPFFLVTVEFLALAPVTDSPVTIVRDGLLRQSKILLAGGTAEDILTTVNDGSVTILDITPTPTETPDPNATPTNTPVPPTPTFTPDPNATATPTETPVPPTLTFTPDPNATATPTETPVPPTLTFTPDPNVTATPTNTPVPPTLTFTPDPNVTATPTNTPVPPTLTITPDPNVTATPTETPVPPTLTFTPDPNVTPTPTETPVPPTLTFTPDPNTTATPTETPVPPTLTFTPDPNVTATPTNTPVPPTLTFTPDPNTTATPTNTPVPPTLTFTPDPNTTATPTETPVPPTLTFTPDPNVTATPTNTPVPPTLTFTPVANATATTTSVAPTATNTAIPGTATATTTPPAPTTTPSGALTLNPTSLPDAIFGAAYNMQIVANGGTGPYTYTLITGSLPGGLVLTTGGQITGVANTFGSFSFTVQAVDSSSPQRTGTRGYSITVPGSLTPTATPTINPALLTPTATLMPGQIPPGATLTPVGPQGIVISTIRASAVRSGPYLGASLITIVRRGATVTLSARSNAEGAVTWYYTTFSNGQAGWISGRNLELSFDPNTLPVQGSIFDQIDNAPTLGIVGTVNASVLNMRVRPSERTARIVQLRFGDEVQVIGRTIIDRRGWSFWYHIRLGDGTVGWVAARYLTIPGSIRNLPVR